MNFNHLYYFWTVGRHGSVTTAAAELNVAQPTISVQIRQLEEFFGEKLFDRTGKRMSLTESGQAVMRYADEMFRLSEDMLRSLRQIGPEQGMPLTVGTADAVPKIVVRSVLAPAMQMEPTPLIICREWRADQLLSELAMHRLDLMISDSPAAPSLDRRTLSHLIATTPLLLAAGPALARKYRAGFPKSLDGAPFVMPTTNNALRESLDRWFLSAGVKPRIVLEAEDRALLHYVAELGEAIVPAAVLSYPQLRRQFNIEKIGLMHDCHESYYAIVIERKQQHPAVDKIVEMTRTGFRPILSV